MKNNLSKEIDDLIKLAQKSKENVELTAALNYLNSVLRIEPKHKKALNNIGNIHKEMKNFNEAIKYYQKSINSNQDYLIPKINLAILYHELGNLSEAKKYYQEIINLDKYNFAIYFNLSRIDFSFFNQEKITFIENSIKRDDISLYNKASGYFILAKNKQIKKKFDEEINFLKMGHEFFCKSIPPRLFEQSNYYWLNIIPKKIGKIKIIDIKENKKDNLEINPIFIIGLPRSGSTLVESIISSGNLKIPNGGETATINWAILKNCGKDILNKNNIISDKNKLRNDIINRYKNLSLLRSDKNFSFTDKSLENFFFIDLIVQLFPKAKFIHCERNKVDNIFAIYQNFLTKMTWTHSLNNIMKYFDNYLNIMDNLKKIYKKNIISIDLKSLTNNSKKISQDIFKFCELEWSEKSLDYHKRKDLFSNTASNIQIREKIYHYDDKKYETYKKYLKKFEQEYSWLKKDLM